MAHTVNRYIALLPARRPSQATGGMWNPAADIYRTPDGWIVKVDLAGVAESDLEIVVEGNSLRLSGVRRDTFYREDMVCQQLEITYSRFEKILHFPCVLTDAHFVQDYRDGLLILHLHHQ